MNNYENLTHEQIDQLPVEKDFQIFKLKAEVAELKRLFFGAKSERFVYSDPSRLKLDIIDEQIAPQPPRDNPC